MKVSVTHDFPENVTSYDHFSLMIPEIFWETMAKETNKYAKQKKEEKGEDKNWKETIIQEIKFFILIQRMFSIYHLPETDVH